MKTLKTIFALLLLSITVQFTTAQETNYFEILDPVYLAQGFQSSTHISSYEKLNAQLIKRGSINFSREIRQARNNKELLVLNGDENSISLEKADYLKMLRKAANRSQNVEKFYNFLTTRIPIFNANTINDNELFKLFDVTRRNSTNGKLDIVSADLSWL